MAELVMQAEDTIIERLTPEKSLNDWNEYRVIVLKSGLKALLISTSVIIYDANDATGTPQYYGDDGPNFLRHGATSRARNLAAEVFFPSTPEKDATITQNNDSEPQDVEMAPNGLAQQNDEQSLEDEMRDDSEEQIESEEDHFDYDEDEESEYEDYEAEELFLEKLLEDDEDAVKFFFECLETHPDILQENPSINADDTDSFPDSFQENACNNIDDLAVKFYDSVPFELADIERSRDEAAKLVLPCSQTRTARNGVVSITFPVGAFSDHWSTIGVADLSRQLIQDCSVISPETGFETNMSTFTRLCNRKDDVDAGFQELVHLFGVPDRTNIKKLLLSKYPHKNPTCQIKNGLDLDSWMLSDKKQLQLLYSLSKQNHPFKAVSPDFYLGLSKSYPKESRDGLFVEDLEGSLSNLRKERYCCHLATIVVQSSESLENLESIVLKHVGCMKCQHHFQETEVQKNDFPFDMKIFANLYKVIYTGIENFEPSLVMSWALSPLLWKNYKSKPMEFVSWLINHKNRGGLFATLEERGWITDIQANCNHTGYHRNDYISLFQIKIKLTDSTVNSFGIIRLIVKTLFSYLKFLDLVGVKKDIFSALNVSREISFNRSEQESNSLRNLQFPFSHPAGPLPKISVLGENMQMIPQENLVDLLKMDTFFEYSEDDVHNLLKCLDIDSCNFMLNCKTFNTPTELTEVYYGTKYSVEKVPSRWKEVNEDEDLSPHFKIPGVESLENPFNCGPPLFDDRDLSPMMEYQDAHVRLYIKSSTNFKNVTSFIMHFGSPLLNTYSPNRAVMTSIISKKLNELVIKDLAPLTLSHFHYSIEPSHIGILVKVFGFQSQSYFAVEFILEKYKELLVNYPQRPQIEPLKRELKENYLVALARPEILARCVYNAVSVMNYVPLMARLNALENLSDDDYDKEISLIQKSSTTGLLALGCCSEVHTLKLATKLPHSSSGDMLQILGNPEIFSYMWPEDHKIIRLVNPNMEKDTVYISQHFQLQIATPKTKALANIMLELVKNEILDSKNHRNRVLLDARINEFNSVIDFEILGSAWNISVDDLEENMKNLMRDIRDDIVESTESYKIEHHTATTLLTLTRSSGKSHHSVINEFHEYERKIKDFTFAFDDIPEEGALYNTIGRREFYEWFSTNFDERERKLSIQIVPRANQIGEKRKKRNKKPQSDQGSDEKVIHAMTGYILVKPGPSPEKSERFIEDLEEFKRSLHLYNTPSAETMTI